MKVGLALSGGGARGIAHLGVLKALDELGVEVHEISGASAGSIAAALYTHGYSPEEALNVISKTSLFKAMWPAFSLSGLLSTAKGEAMISKYLESDSFDQADRPLKVVATNLNTGKAEVFTSGSLVKALMASSCIPFMFEPVKINGQTYVDGGIVNNLPAECLRESCDLVIGVNVVPVIPQDEIGGVKKMIERVSMIALSANVHSSGKLCDVLITPRELRKYGTLDIKYAREIFEIGYEYAHHIFEADREETPVKRLLGDKSYL